MPITQSPPIQNNDETPLIKAFGDAFDLLVKSYEKLPAYPRPKLQTMLFKGAARRGKTMKSRGHLPLAKACSAFQAELASLKKSMVVNRMASIIQDAATHFAEGRMSAYELDILRNKALLLANRMEARQ